MDHHLAGEGGAANIRNDYGRKSVVTDSGRIVLEAKNLRRFPGFDDKITSMYARGMRTREIAGHLLDLFGI